MSDNRDGNFFEKFYDTGTWATFILNIVSGAALLAAASWFSYNIFSTKDAELPPRIVNSIQIEPAILLPGSKFKAHINVTLNRLCPYEVHWSLVRVTDGVEVVKVIEPIKPAPLTLGTQDLPVSDRYIPNAIGPGEYKYVSEVYDMCPDGHTFTSIRHDVPITIR
jgi:hypothetical protein